MTDQRTTARKIDTAWSRVVERLAAPGYASSYRTEADFEIDVWRRIAPLAAQLGFSCLTSHKIHRDRSVTAWKAFCQDEKGPDVRVLSSNNRLDIVLRHEQHGSIGIEVKCLGAGRHAGKLTQGIGQALLSLANRERTVLLIHCGTVKRGEREQLRQITATISDGPRFRLVVVP